MRKEASKEEWKKLYDVATRIKELKPWEDFWDLDLICLREGEREDAAFVSVLGRGGDVYKRQYQRRAKKSNVGMKNQPLMGIRI